MMGQLPSVGPTQCLADLINSVRAAGARPHGGVRQAATAMNTAPRIMRQIPSYAPPAARSHRILFLPRLAEQAVALILQGWWGELLSARFASDPTPGAGLCARCAALSAPAPLNIELQQCLTPTHRQVERFGWRALRRPTRYGSGHD